MNSQIPSEVIQNIGKWQNWKFGLFVHWGPYSQIKLANPWTLCGEDKEFCGLPLNSFFGKIYLEDYVTCVDAYKNLSTTFNPLNFDPVCWARIAIEAGIRYVIFTTKQYDGFSMFDTRQSDYKVTSPSVPFHKNIRSNIAKAVFDACRAYGLGVGAYFSKADWHNDNYWWKRFPTPNRHVNYKISKYPQRWTDYVALVHAQIGELTGGDYGELDLLWLEGDWVRPARLDDNQNLSDIADFRPGSEDIKIDSLVALARQRQPSLIVADRGVGGSHENFQTFEEEIPLIPLPYPWQACLTLTDFSSAGIEQHKSARMLVQNLIDVVAKGGNLLLSVGPDGQGELPSKAIECLRQIGQWLIVNGEAIYDSRTVAPFTQGRFRFTKIHDGTIFAIYVPCPDETMLPAIVTIPGHSPAANVSVEVLGCPLSLSWVRIGDSTEVQIPLPVRQALVGSFAWTFRLRQS